MKSSDELGRKGHIVRTEHLHFTLSKETKHFGDNQLLLYSKLHFLDLVH